MKKTEKKKQVGIVSFLAGEKLMEKIDNYVIIFRREHGVKTTRSGILNMIIEKFFLDNKEIDGKVITEIKKNEIKKSWGM